jgi:hypothetical protein
MSRQRRSIVIQMSEKKERATPPHSHMCTAQSNEREIVAIYIEMPRLTHKTSVSVCEERRESRTPHKNKFFACEERRRKNKTLWHLSFLVTDKCQCSLSLARSLLSLVKMYNGKLHETPSNDSFMDTEMEPKLNFSLSLSLFPHSAFSLLNFLDLTILCQCIHVCVCVCRTILSLYIQATTAA